MEKKKYNKPRVNNTRLDESINILLDSNGVTPGNNPGTVPNANVFINPLKWLK